MNFNITNTSSNHKIYLFNDISSIEDGLLSAENKEKLKEDKKSSLNFHTQDAFTCIFLLKEDKEKNRVAGFDCFTKLKSSGINDIEIINTTTEEQTLDFLEGLLLSTYTFNKYKSEAKEFVLDISIAKGIDKVKLNNLLTLVESVFAAKDLVNEPHSFLNATQYSKEMKRLGENAGYSTTVFDKKKIEELKMGGILAVNKGSVQPPTFNILEWKPSNAKNTKPIVLVGKGVVYDTGGLSLKPTPNSMDMMKCDMGGSAVVVGTLHAIAKMELPIHVIGLISATDNRPGLDAVAPGDVITMYSGKTVEVLNTDAEGRLVMADALHYAKQYNPEMVFDFATLTGAAARAIGHYGIVCMGTADEKIKNDLKASGNNVYERLVEFPFWEEYGETIKSDIADIKNLGGPAAGMITAGKFLEHFIDYPWMHFDIAGPAYIKAQDKYRGKYATGTGVRLMVDFLRAQCQ